MGNFWEFCRRIRRLSYIFALSANKGYKNPGKTRTS